MHKHYPELFAGIDEINLSGLSPSRVVDEHYYVRPVGGKQNFRIGYLDERRAQDNVVDLRFQAPVAEPLFVIPAKAGIQFFQVCLDPGLRRGDGVESGNFLKSTVLRAQDLGG